MILRLLAGLLAPLRPSLVVLLRSELRNLRPGAADLPDAVLLAFVDNALAVGDLVAPRASRPTRRAAAVERIASYAWLIATRLDHPERLPAAPSDWIGEILRAHGIAVPSHVM